MTIEVFSEIFRTLPIMIHLTITLDNVEPIKSQINTKLKQFLYGK